LEKPKTKSDGEHRVVDYNHLHLKRTEGSDAKWCYEIKEVDRRISYPFVQESSMVCDVGGARGIDSFAFAEKDAFVIDIDINGVALKIGNEYAQQCGLKSNLNFVKASATNLPFRTEVFDLVTCFSTLDHLPSKRSSYDSIVEFSRVVRKYGHVAITVPNSLFLVGTISMKIKSITEPEAFQEQRFNPKELFRALSRCGLLPIVFDAEFPKSVNREILVLHFPRLLRRMPGMVTLLSLGTKILDQISKVKIMKLFGARVGYSSVKTDQMACMRYPR
jgi:ubiquinone/menaquinone biosynthesis C-methylase UbiE